MKKVFIRSDKINDPSIRDISHQDDSAICLNCGANLTPVKDSMTDTFTGYLWKCVFCSPDKVISIG